MLVVLAGARWQVLTGAGMLVEVLAGGGMLMEDSLVFAGGGTCWCLLEAC